MIVTEPTARQLVCPKYRDNADSACIGSRCMAWRWIEVNVVDDAFTEAVKKVAEEIVDASAGRAKAAREVSENRAKYGLPTVPTRGYCGLAGVPHDLPKVLRG